MTATPDDWRRGGEGGRRARACRPPTTPARVVVRVDGDHAGGRSHDGPGGIDPFSGKLDQTGSLTHGHLPENDNHGGKDTAALADARGLPPGPLPTGHVADRQLPLRPGDLRGRGARAPAGDAQGQPLDVRQPRRRATRTIFHTITACRAPCNRVDRHRVPARRRPTSSSTPASSASARRLHRRGEPRHVDDARRTSTPGTYTYFCRVHPFMRGAFRVKG